jgi:hypothetical protein
MTTTEHIQVAMKKFPKAKRIAVENFCWSAPDDKFANRVNLGEDTRMYSWNSHTVSAIEYVLGKEGKIQ